MGRERTYLFFFYHFKVYGEGFGEDLKGRKLCWWHEWVFGYPSHWYWRDWICLCQDRCWSLLGPRLPVLSLPPSLIGAIICLLSVLLLIFPRSIGHWFCVPVWYCQDWTSLWVCGQKVKLLLRVDSDIPSVVSSSSWKLTERHLPASIWKVNRSSQAGSVSVVAIASNFSFPTTCLMMFPLQVVFSDLLKTKLPLRHGQWNLTLKW